jgi:hypothetical protein
VSFTQKLSRKLWIKDLEGHIIGEEIINNNYSLQFGCKRYLFKILKLNILQISSTSRWLFAFNMEY